MSVRSLLQVLPDTGDGGKELEARSQYCREVFPMTYAGWCVEWKTTLRRIGPGTVMLLQCEDSVKVT